MQSSVNVDLLNTAAVTVSSKIGLNTRVHVKASGRQKSIIYYLGVQIESGKMDNEGKEET
eukprot:scaffold53972_cov63-Cyclotella_meneghiniana.AAC.2